MSAGVIWFLLWIGGHSIIGWIVVFGYWLCCADVFSGLVHVAFCGGFGLGKMFVDGLSGYARPGGKESLLYGLYPRRFDRAECSCMEEIDECGDRSAVVGTVKLVLDLGGLVELWCDCLGGCVQLCGWVC